MANTGRRVAMSALRGFFGLLLLVLAFEHRAWAEDPPADSRIAFRLVPEGRVDVTGLGAKEFGRIPRSDSPLLFPDAVSYSIELRAPIWFAELEATADLVSILGGRESSSATRSSTCQLPAVGISLVDAASLANALSALLGFEQCYQICESAAQGFMQANEECLGIRIPTPEEWEYAARSGSSSELYTGQMATVSGLRRSTELDELAWYGWNSEGQPRCVGRKKPNGFGLYDVLGNAGELTWREGLVRIMGCNWTSDVSHCTLGSFYRPEGGYATTGLRFVFSAISNGETGHRKVFDLGFENLP